MSESVAQLQQTLDLPPTVELFIVTHNGLEYLFTNSFRDTPIFWDGKEFTPFSGSISSVKYTEDNAAEKPRLVLSNVENLYNVMFASIPNLKGASLDYVLVAEPFLGTDAGSSTALSYMTHRFTFAKLLSKNEMQIVYEMNTLLAFGNKRFPRRQMLREGLPKLRFEGLGLNKSAN